MEDLMTDDSLIDDVLNLEDSVLSAAVREESFSSNGKNRSTMEKSCQTTTNVMHSFLVSWVNELTPNYRKPVHQIVPTNCQSRHRYQY